MDDINAVFAEGAALDVHFLGGVGTAAREGDFVHTMEREQTPNSNKRRGNQYRPTVPDHILLPIVKQLHSQNIPVTQMVKYVKDQVGEEYGISEKTIRRRMKDYGLQSTYGQHHTVESITCHVQEVKKTYPAMGARSLTGFLRCNYGVNVPEKAVLETLRIIEPQAVALRKKGKYKRRQYIAAGVNENWTMDQHDKFLKYGVAMHVCIEPFSGYVIWAKAWHTNKNPKVVAGWYLEAARKLGGIPLFTQSDPGTENFRVANMHTLIRQALDTNLKNTIQHKWMRKHQNIKPEIFWSGFRRSFTQKFEDLFIEGGGDHRGVYDMDNNLHVLVHHWLVIPWFQDHLNVWIHTFNNTKRRACKQKLLPQGVPPALIFKHAHLHASEDFKIVLDSKAPILAQVEEKYAPPNDPVFQLVPPDFDQKAQEVFQIIQAPHAISLEDLWEIFESMVYIFENTAWQIPTVVWPADDDGSEALLDGYDKYFAYEPLEVPEELKDAAGRDVRRDLTLGRGMKDTEETEYYFDVPTGVLTNVGVAEYGLVDGDDDMDWAEDDGDDKSEDGILRVPITNIDEYYD